jgi:hypothetical protein
MSQSIDTLGRITGLAGALACAVAGAMRLSGNYYLAGHEVTTMFTAGTSLMIFACLLRLEALARKSG